MRNSQPAAQLPAVFREDGIFVIVPESFIEFKFCVFRDISGVCPVTNS
jgi:hypothetical protein